MDVEWVRSRLADYLRDLEAYSGAQYRPAGVRDRLLMAQPALSYILKACGQPELTPIAWTLGSVRGVHAQRTAILGALGWLDDQADLERALGPRGPELSATGLHGWVWEPAAPLWSGGHYRQAVAAAAGNLSLKVQTKLDRWDLADDALMTEVLSSKPPQPGKPRLRVPVTPGRPFEAALQDGTSAFARGCFSLLRNPSTHNVNEHWSEQRALESLAALSILARALDSATVETAPDATSAAGTATG